MILNSQTGAVFVRNALFGLICGIVLNDGALAAPETVPTVSVRMISNRYATNEPIGVAVVFENPTRYPLRLSFDHPTFKLDFVNGSLKLNSNDDAIRVRKEFTGLRITNYSVVQTIVPPNKKVESKFHIQQFFNQPPPGTHTFSYSFRHTGCLMKPRDEEDGITVKAEGKLSFLVEAVEAKEQRAVFEKLVKTIQEKDQSSKSLCEIQALATVDDPIVIPYLARLAAGRKDPHLSPVYAAINRFANDKKAIAVVNEALESNNPSMSPIEIVTLLCYWKHRLSVSQIQRLQKNGDKAFEARLQEYLRIMNDQLKKND